MLKDDDTANGNTIYCSIDKASQEAMKRDRCRVMPRMTAAAPALTDNPLASESN